MARVSTGSGGARRTTPRAKARRTRARAQARISSLRAASKAGFPVAGGAAKIKKLKARKKVAIRTLKGKPLA